MANHKTSLLRIERETGQTIMSGIVGRHDRRPYDDTEARPDEGVLLDREALLAKVDGGADCYPFYAWTDDWIIFVREYDGATCLGRLPRSPSLPLDTNDVHFL